MITLEAILDGKNLKEALRQTVSNKGSAGVDGMSVYEIEPWIRDNPRKLTTSIREGRYKPLPVKRVYIPKDNGEKRPLGIPTVIDRLVQQATAQVLSKEYEPEFVRTSYGFRPGKSAQMAIKQVQGYLNEGYEYVVDLDLSKFFDTVNHGKLLQVLSKKIKDRRVLSLIRKFLTAKIEDNKELIVPTQGTPQGGPCSPILANILLNELDHELERRGHKFVRYADDMIIFCKSIRSAQRTFENISKYIEQKLFLRINKEKTRVCRMNPQVKFLGFTLYKNSKLWKIAIHRKVIKKLKECTKELTNRRCIGGIEMMQYKLKLYLKGWYEYFKMGLRESFITKYDQWLRRRIRQMYWKQWKNISTRMIELIKLGVKPMKAYEWANTAKSYWRISDSYILSTTLNNEELNKRGWTMLSNLMK